MQEKAHYSSSSTLHPERGQRRFKQGALSQIAFPLGGLGAGCICLAGYGGFIDLSIKNRPANSCLLAGYAEGQAEPHTAFAVLHVKGEKAITRLLEGPFPTDRIYNHGLESNGLHFRGGHEGLPRFEGCTFQGEFPFGYVTLSDSSIPLEVKLTGWSPFIPLDDWNSGIPCAIAEYTFENNTQQVVDFEFSFHLSHLATAHEPGHGTLNTVMPGKGIFFHNNEEPSAAGFGSASLTAIGQNARVKGMWLRGGWFDAITALWQEISSGQFKPNKGTTDASLGGRNGGSILVGRSLSPGQKTTIPIVITWHFPNCHYATAGAEIIRNGSSCCDSTTPTAPLWQPYYTNLWKDARDVAAYVRKHYDTLRSRTHAFKEALFSSSAPAYVLDAVSANLAILKSPTVLRQQSGTFWGWEGCHPHQGCCAGSCTHVWNYAQALPHLFPQLERTLREQELERSMHPDGNIRFRSSLPAGPPKLLGLAAADGQPGGIMKLYRDWQICGDDFWMGRLYPLAKKSLDYCIEKWDPDHKGVFIEPHHNTYDIEFWGPDGMCSSVYLGALTALSNMAQYLGKETEAASYRKLAKRGARYLDEILFNGEYFEQKVTWEELRDQGFAEMVQAECDAEARRLLKREGPKYQYGSGCLSDGVIGAWMSRIYGIDTPQTRSKIKKHLKSVYKYNFRSDLAEHACTQRPGYAMGHEAGLLLCSWPRGGKPTLPFVYSDEVWTGIEYQVASHLIAEGFVEEGFTIVRSLRDRYDGRVRNPWNEYECGNYYARAMASYALLIALSGFRYSAVEKTLWLEPQLAVRPFTTFFSSATGFGTITLEESRLVVEMTEGELDIEKVCLTRNGKTETSPWPVVATPKRKAIREWQTGYSRKDVQCCS
jgi:uncharacterized protein (DUF608 family)